MAKNVWRWQRSVRARAGNIWGAAHALLLMRYYSSLFIAALAGAFVLQAADNPLSTELKQNYEQRKNALLAEADRMADADYSFKATPDVGTFGSRVAHVAEFTDAITRIAAGGTALDPEVVSGLLNASRHASALRALTAREQDVLALMAEGRSNGAIADRIAVSERAVEKHISNIFTKLCLPPSDSDHRRVLAVLAYLGT